MISTLVTIHFFFNDTATTEIYTLSLHDALPISKYTDLRSAIPPTAYLSYLQNADWVGRSEEHTSELQSLTNLVCRLLLEKKKNIKINMKHMLRELIDIRRNSAKKSDRTTITSSV